MSCVACVSVFNVMEGECQEMDRECVMTCRPQLDSHRDVWTWTFRTLSEEIWLTTLSVFKKVSVLRLRTLDDTVAVKNNQMIQSSRTDSDRVQGPIRCYLMSCCQVFSLKVWDVSEAFRDSHSTCLNVFLQPVVIFFVRKTFRSSFRLKLSLMCVFCFTSWSQISSKSDYFTASQSKSLRIYLVSAALKHFEIKTKLYYNHDE